jgi:hypothetical protein
MTLARQYICFVQRFDPMSHDIGTLAPHERVHSLHVIREIGLLASDNSLIYYDTLEYTGVLSSPFLFVPPSELERTVPRQTISWVISLSLLCP